MTPPERRWLITGLVLAISGGGLLPVALVDMTAARKPMGWETTTGVIEHAGIRAAMLASGRLGSAPAYTADVRYRYTVAGRIFRGDRVHVDVGTEGEPAALATAARYTIGAHVPVYFNPANPADAVLDRSVQSTTWQALFATSAALLLGLVCLARFASMRRASAPSTLVSTRPNRQMRRRTKAERRRRP